MPPIPQARRAIIVEALGHGAHPVDCISGHGSHPGRRQPLGQEPDDLSVAAGYGALRHTVAARQLVSREMWVKRKSFRHKHIIHQDLVSDLRWKRWRDLPSTFVMGPLTCQLNYGGEEKWDLVPRRKASAQYFFDAESKGVWQAVDGLDINELNERRDARKARSSQNEAVRRAKRGQTGADGHKGEFTQPGEFLGPDLVAQVSEELCDPQEFSEHGVHHQPVHHKLADSL
jgi:hypothetical protein